MSRERELGSGALTHLLGEKGEEWHAGVDCMSQSAIYIVSDWPIYISVVQEFQHENILYYVSIETKFLGTNVSIGTDEHSSLSIIYTDTELCLYQRLINTKSM